MTRLLPETEFDGFYPETLDTLTKQPAFNDVADLLECWSSDPEQMLEDLTYEQVLHLLWLSVENKPCFLKVRDFASECLTRKLGNV